MKETQFGCVLPLGDWAGCPGLSSAALQVPTGNVSSNPIWDLLNLISSTLPFPPSAAVTQNLLVLKRQPGSCPRALALTVPPAWNTLPHRADSLISFEFCSHVVRQISPIPYLKFHPLLNRHYLPLFISLLIITFILLICLVHLKNTIIMKMWSMFSLLLYPQSLEEYLAHSRYSVLA